MWETYNYSIKRYPKITLKKELNDSNFYNKYNENSLSKAKIFLIY